MTAWYARLWLAECGMCSGQVSVGSALQVSNVWEASTDPCAGLMTITTQRFCKLLTSEAAKLRFGVYKVAKYGVVCDARLMVRNLHFWHRMAPGMDRPQPVPAVLQGCMDIFGERKLCSMTGEVIAEPATRKGRTANYPQYGDWVLLGNKMPSWHQTINRPQLVWLSRACLFMCTGADMDISGQARATIHVKDVLQCSALYSLYIRACDEAGEPSVVDRLGALLPHTPVMPFASRNSMISCVSCICSASGPSCSKQSRHDTAGCKSKRYCEPFCRTTCTHRTHR